MTNLTKKEHLKKSQRTELIEDLLWLVIAFAVAIWFGFFAWWIITKLVETGTPVG